MKVNMLNLDLQTYSPSALQQSTHLKQIDNSSPQGTSGNRNTVASGGGTSKYIGLDTVSLTSIRPSEQPSPVTVSPHEPYIDTVNISNAAENPQVAAASRLQELTAQLRDGSYSVSSTALAASILRQGILK